MNIKELAPKIFEANKAKGFWDEGPDRNFGEAIMLVTDEISEAHEAWRRSKRAQLSWFSHDAELWEEMFRHWVKDTFEDELADACIRLMDIAFGYGMNLDRIQEQCVRSEKVRSNPLENMGEELLNLQDTIFLIYRHHISRRGYSREDMLGVVLGWISSLASKLSIDLAKHIDLKLQYNATRPHKHGKAY